MPTNDRINTILGRNMVIYDANNRAKQRSDSSNGAPGGTNRIRTPAGRKPKNREAARKTRNRSGRAQRCRAAIEDDGIHSEAHSDHRGRI